MKQTFLFPHKWQKIGWMVLIPTLLVGLLILLNDIWNLPNIVSVFEQFTDLFNIKVPQFQFSSPFFLYKENNLLNEIIIFGIIVGSTLISFSKEKIEDEMISNLRLYSLMWAVVVHFSLVLIASLLFYEFDYFNVMTIQMFSILFLFIIHFKYQIHQYNKSIVDEK
ncbi:MAG: hypothetical protein KJ941_06055 [Bacteroidetes bacterium]|nr:hypothetical protein [Bacteroidota bacterium]